MAKYWQLTSASNGHLTPAQYEHLTLANYEHLTLVKYGLDTAKHELHQFEINPKLWWVACARGTSRCQINQSNRSNLSNRSNCSNPKLSEHQLLVERSDRVYFL
jgi:hypothetical protein